MAATSGTYMQCGLWRFIGVSGMWADRLQSRQRKGLDDRRSDTAQLSSFLVEQITGPMPVDSSSLALYGHPPGPQYTHSCRSTVSLLSGRSRFSRRLRGRSVDAWVMGAIEGWRKINYFIDAVTKSV